MRATLHDLLSQEQFHLVPQSTLSAESTALPLTWVHSSDLTDPTPWLSPGGLLLTDGLQFSDDATADAYVTRLAGAGVAALGFATGIVHDEIPTALRTACATHALPLIEVANGTPFMGIIRFVADAAGAEQRQQLERSLHAQRSVARAAMRPDGLPAIVRELERHLDCWVALYDAAGGLVVASDRHDVPAAQREDIEAQVHEILRRGTPAASRLSAAGAADVTLQSIGQREHLRGVLAVGTGTGLDRVGTDLIESVIALASIALEQSATLDIARRRLRSGLIELLSAGILDVAGRTAQHLWGDLPAAPIQVACVVVAESAPGTTEALLAALELRAATHPGHIFHAERGDHIFVVFPVSAASDVRRLLLLHGAGAGISDQVGWDAFSQALTEARRAAARTTADQPFLAFSELSRAGLIGHLEATGAEAIARRLLEPLTTADTDGTLAQTARIWLEHNGAWDPSAKALGVHRHTLRARIDSISRLLGTDLDAFHSRAELWQALTLTAEGRAPERPHS